MAAEVQQFEALELRIDVTFWNELAKRKLDEYRLSAEPVAVTARYRPGSSALELDYTSFSVPATSASASAGVIAQGRLVVVNTPAEFRALDKRALLAKYAADVWRELSDASSSSSSGATPTPCRFLIACYGDLKRHDFVYVAAILALRFACNNGDPRAAAPPRDATDAERTEALAALAAAPAAAWVPLGAGRVALWDAAPASSPHPSWPLRNVLSRCAAVLSQQSSAAAEEDNVFDALCVRGNDCVRVFRVRLPNVAAAEPPIGVGWTAPRPRTVSLGSALDPRRLAETAVDLNVKLMRWRMLPELAADRVAQTRCLLLGAGTLGCAVARGLLGWGVRCITFVDNGRVSYSNPVRQTLFTFADCANGGRWKAEAAADRLQQVFPGVDARGHVLTIPMPGHHVPADNEQRVRETVALLEKLVTEHDAVFLLGDSREVRWLPTLLGAVHRKLVINVGLGFDSYVVMRHGVRAEAEERSSSSSDEQLGCYFCSDVVAPRDSVSDRTLDQACTVTRPGVSMVASALACELLVSVLHHPLGPAAPANGTCALGGVPHQLRGFLSQWSTLQLSGGAYDRCTACSNTVVSEYRRRGFGFLLDAFNNPAYLEELTGLAALRKQRAADEAQASCTEEECEPGWTPIGGDQDDF